MSDEGERIWKVPEAARFLGLGKSTLRGLAARFKISYIQLTKRRIGFLKKYLIDYRDKRIVSTRDDKISMQDRRRNL